MDKIDPPSPARLFSHNVHIEFVSVQQWTRGVFPFQPSKNLELEHQLFLRKRVSFYVQDRISLLMNGDVYSGDAVTDDDPGFGSTIVVLQRPYLDTQYPCKESPICTLLT